MPSNEYATDEQFSDVTTSAFDIFTVTTLRSSHTLDIFNIIHALERLERKNNGCEVNGFGIYFVKLSTFAVSILLIYNLD